MRFIDQHPELRQRGAIAALARHLGVTHSAVAQWKRVPAERVSLVSSVTGIPREVLRPDIFTDATPEKQ